MSVVTETGPGATDPAQPVEPDQSLSDLVSRLTTDVGNLIGTQIELAKVEIKDEVTRAGKGVGMVGGGGLAATKMQKEIARTDGKAIKYVTVEW